MRKFESIIDANIGSRKIESDPRVKKNENRNGKLKLREREREKLTVTENDVIATL